MAQGPEYNGKYATLKYYYYEGEGHNWVVLEDDVVFRFQLENTEMVTPEYDGERYRWLGFFDSYSTGFEFKPANVGDKGFSVTSDGLLAINGTTELYACYLESSNYEVPVVTQRYIWSSESKCTSIALRAAPVSVPGNPPVSSAIV